MANESIAFALPDLGEDESAAVLEVVKSRWLTTGPKTKSFEAAFAKATESKHAVMLNSCTAALHLALEAVGVQPGDEVIVPSMTFAASAEVVRYLGATPVLVDVRESDHNIDVLAVERALSPRTRAVMPVHFAGLPCEMDEIMTLTRDRGVSVIADSAHCFPGSYRGRNVGRLADITCFSFYATKTITTGEGGAVVTERDDWAERIRIMSLHGISKDAWKRYSAEGSWYYEILAPGFKYNLTDLASAIGLVQLAKAEQMLERRRDIARRYDAAFKAVEPLELMVASDDRDHAHHLYVLKLRSGLLSIGRDGFIEEMRAAGIGTSVHFIPLHSHPYYREAFGYSPEQLPVAWQLFQRSLSLPIYSGMSDEAVDRVIGAVIDIAHRFRR